MHIDLLPATHPPANPRLKTESLSGEAFCDGDKNGSVPLLIVPIWIPLKARKRSPGNAAFPALGGRKLKNATSAAACQPSCRRSFPLKFASKYYPLHSLLSPITGSLSAHLIHRQPVAQPSVLFGRCQAVSPSRSSRIRRLLNLYRISAGTQNCYPKLGSASLLLGPLPLQEFPPFLFHL